MKKEYIKPEVYAVNLTGSSAILIGSDNSIPGGNSNVIPKSGGSRDEWGNLWSK